MKKLPIIIYKDEDGVLIAESPLLPGFHTYGNNKTELKKNIKEALALYQEAAAKVNLPHYTFVDINFTSREENSYVTSD